MDKGAGPFEACAAKLVIFLYRYSVVYPDCDKVWCPVAYSCVNSPLSGMGSNTRAGRARVKSATIGLAETISLTGRVKRRPRRDARTRAWEPEDPRNSSSSMNDDPGPSIRIATLYSEDGQWTFLKRFITHLARNG